MKFFSPIENLLNRVNSIDSKKVVKKVFDNKILQGEILDHNFQDQLYEKGVDANSQSLGEYSHYTKEIKLAGDGDHRTDHITLKDTGKFYASGKVINDMTGFFINANTIVDDGSDLQRRFGKSILGLTDESKNEILPEVKELTIEVLREQIKGKSI